MILLLLSVIITAIAVAISIFRHHISVGSLIRSETGRGDFYITQKRADQPRFVAGPMNQLLVVVLPDGKIVTAMVADRM
jgi:hypothetical protein